MKLLKNEIIKNLKWKVFIISLLLTVAVNVVGILIVEKGDKENWKENALNIRQSYSESLEECLEEGVEENYYTVFEEQIKLIDFSLEHNVPYGVMTAKKHVMRMTEMFRVLVIAFMFLISGVVADEYESRTWKNLLMTGVSKRKLLCTKETFCCLYAIGLLIGYFVICAICGMIAFGVNTSGVGLEVVNGTVMQINQYAEIFKVYMLFAIKLVFYTTITVTAVVFLKKGIFALLIVSILSFSNDLIASMIPVDLINKVLPFRYLAMSEIQNTMEWIKMFLVLLGYTIVFVLLSRIKFEKSDLVS